MPPVSEGRQWRSLEELEGDPVLLERAAQEFPLLREFLKQPRDRRQMLRLMGAALAAAGLSGCYSGEPSGHLIPPVYPPPDIIAGLPNHYATAHVLSGYAIGTVVTHQGGRPIKVDGNPNHPSSLGGSSPWAQAEVLGFYDPDRSMIVTRRGAAGTRQGLMRALVAAQEQAMADKGNGLRILTGALSSPTVIRLIETALAKYPQAQWHVWEPVNRDAIMLGAKTAYGKPLEIVAKPAQADVILGLDSDLIGYGPGWVRYAREFASRRNPTRTKAMSRVYAVEPSPTLLGSVADHRFAASPRDMNAVLNALADAILGGGSGGDAPPWVAAVADDLKAHKGAALIAPGPALPAEAHALVIAMNEALGGQGKTYELIEPVLGEPAIETTASVSALVRDMHDGKVSTLLILDSNPVFTTPGTLGFATAMERVPVSFAFNKWPDETAAAASWGAPLAHDWETWNDARGHDGTATVMQPMALPLYQGFTMPEVLARLKGEVPQPEMKLVQDTWNHGASGSASNVAKANEAGSGTPSDPKAAPPKAGAKAALAFAERWHDTLARGFIEDSTYKPVKATLSPSIASKRLPVGPAARLEILFRPDPHVWDGRYANNPWLQELPAPLTKLTWDNPLLISPEMARRLKLENGDMVNLRTDVGAMAIPVWVQPGQAAGVVLAWYGNGRRVTGAVGTGAGFDVYPMKGGTSEAELVAFKGKEQLASTIHHAVIYENEDTIVRHATLAEFARNPNFAKGKQEPELYLRKPGSETAWGMAVDMNACIGCNACVVACQAENNVPTVGKDQVLIGREMQWLRIDRYYEGTPEQPEAFFQPMFCQMCEEAPCELVCPPGATMHDAEGLNVMVYNRCIGTRFCSNNCPYKVRRFNFFPYARDQNRPPVSWNNNVSVRSGGVMEKCTYCVQRIWSARIIAAQTGVADGTLEVRTACQAACPTQALTFGDQNNKETEVYKRKQSPLDYQLLENLNTHPRTTYEALVRNPNPALPKTRA